MAPIARPDRWALPVDDTLRWIAVGYRVLAWVWVLILVTVELARDSDSSRPILATGLGVATVWLGVTLWAGRSNRRLGGIWFVVFDGIVALALSAVGWIAGTDDFVSGGWPGSWLFMVAFASTLRWTLVAGLGLITSHVILHLLHNLPPGRTAGTFQFITLALVIGWTFDSLRHREHLRLRAEKELADEQQELARQEERSRLALHLHDSVLQTLHAIRVDADDADEVRYLARRQERELRRTIEEFRSPHGDSFRARLLGNRDEVEDLCRGVKITDVIRDDTAVTPAIATALAAAREAMLNAGRHSGANQIDLYSEITDGEAIIHVRDRGAGFVVAENHAHGIDMAMHSPVEDAGGQVIVQSTPGEGTEVTIRVPCL